MRLSNEKDGGRAVQKGRFSLFRQPDFHFQLFIGDGTVDNHCDFSRLSTFVKFDLYF